MLPYFKRSENSWRGADLYNGTDGPMTVSRSAGQNPLYELFAASVVTRRFARCLHYNGAVPEEVAVPDFTIGNGRRQFTARAFLRPAMARANLTVGTGGQAERVCLQNGRAVGVDYRCGRKLVTAHAGREISLSGGSYHSPQLLMPSGIGLAEVLKALGVVPMLDRPGVGQNLQDHVNAVIIFDMAAPLSSVDDLRWDRLALSVLRWTAFGTGSLASMQLQCIAFFCLRAESTRPDIELLVIPISPDAAIWFPGVKWPVNHSFSSRVLVLHPHSRGHVALRSADAADQPRIFWNLRDVPYDLDTLRFGLETVRAVFPEEPLSRLVGGEASPGPGALSKADVVAWIRAHCQTATHPAGTCRMGIDDDAVVDESPRVKGVEGLRVADCSAMPELVGAKTNAPVIMIAETGADEIPGRSALPSAV